MNIIDKKPQEQTKNEFYGVDVNDRQAVQEEYNRLRKRHTIITIVVIIALIVLGFLAFDVYRVTELNGKPILAFSKKVDKGTLFSGIGYKVLYCENGERYVGSVLYKNCGDFDENSFTSLIYEKLIDYSIDKKTLDINNLNYLTISNAEFDESNDQDGADYYLDINYTCKDESSKCFKTDKEFNDPLKIGLYVRLNRYNEIYEIVTFKNSGEHYTKLVEDYTLKVKNYMLENEMITEDNLKSLKLSLVSNNGKYKFRGNIYADSYLIEINYLCNDNSNTCVKAFDKKDQEGDYANLQFFASMFLNENNEVILVGNREYLDM